MVELRTKTIKKFDENDLSSLREFAEKFCTFDESTAKEILIWATCNPETFVLVNKWNMPIKTEEQLGCFKGDLKLAYKAAHPEAKFLEDNEYTEGIKKAFNNDMLILNALDERIQICKYSMDLEEKKRVDYLLRSDLEKNKYGGLRALGYAPDLARYALNASIELANYWKETAINICENKSFTEIPKAEQTAKKPIENIKPSIPLYTTNVINEKAAKPEKLELEVIPVIKEKISHKIDATIILENEEIFRKFIDLKTQIDELNLNLELVNADNYAKLKNFVNAANAF